LLGLQAEIYLAESQNLEAKWVMGKIFRNKDLEVIL
jgi:hypothetical protein